MKVTKDGNTFDVNGVQLTAFINSGYELVKEEAKDENVGDENSEKTKPKGKGAKK